jgi:hypothetical protein
VVSVSKKISGSDRVTPDIVTPRTEMGLHRIRYTN